MTVTGLCTEIEDQMPRYTYRCKKCEETFEVVHSIKEKLADCEKCKTKDTLIRVPPLLSRFKKKEQEKKPGTIVKKYIEEVKNEVKEEKKKLKKGTYEE